MLSLQLIEECGEVYFVGPEGRRAGGQEGRRAGGQEGRRADQQPRRRLDDRQNRAEGNEGHDDARVTQRIQQEPGLV